MKDDGRVLVALGVGLVVGVGQVVAHGPYSSVDEAKRPTGSREVAARVRAGTRVSVSATPASRALYSAGLPADGTQGVVGKASTAGSGLVFVDFDNGTRMGVSRYDLQRMPTAWGGRTDLDRYVPKR